MAKIRSLAVNMGKQKEMKYEEKIRIIEKFGIEGDRFSSYNDLRQIMIVDGNLYDLHQLKKGVLRENILIDDLDINSLEEGNIILINGSIRLRVTLLKDACASASYNDPEVIKKLQGNMYAFVTPLEDGFISINDKVEIL
ncbi:MAG: hypothetical protein FI730_05370 [SAR202 cluster bacterium]|nr:hypothetical protein [SAR202 cluster bacterium]MQF93872.1 hypothetical protein [SAR202 cluster bacterium]